MNRTGVDSILHLSTFNSNSHFQTAHTVLPYEVSNYLLHRIETVKWQCAKTQQRFLTKETITDRLIGQTCHCFWPTVRSGLCHRKSVCLSVCLSVTLVYCGQTA